MADAAPEHDWQRLFARCEKWGRDNAEWERSKGNEIRPDRQPATMAPATEAQIAREEARLGMRLPPSLRSFYLHSNGHGAVGNFIWAVRSVEQIGWLRDVEPEFYENIFEDDAAVGRSLVVSRAADSAWWLLDPVEVNGRGEWRAGCWASWHPGMGPFAESFFGLFEQEVLASEQLLKRMQSPPPVPGAGRARNESTVGDINSSTVVDGYAIARNGYMYVPAEGFASRVIASVRPTARVGEWVALNATRRSGPWNPVRREEVRSDEISMFQPRIFEREVAGNLSWNVDPPGTATFNTHAIPGIHPEARCIMFDAPGTYKLRGISVFPFQATSNEVTIRVES